MDDEQLVPLSDDAQPSGFDVVLRGYDRRQVDDYLDRSDRPGFVVHGGNPKAHPNAVTATEFTSRRTQQASQFRRRLSDVDIAEATAVLDRFPLGSWGPTNP